MMKLPTARTQAAASSGWLGISTRLSRTVLLQPEERRQLGNLRLLRLWELFCFFFFFFFCINFIIQRYWNKRNGHSLLTALPTCMLRGQSCPRAALPIATLIQPELHSTDGPVAA